MKKTIVLFLFSLLLQNLSAQEKFHYGANIAAVQTVRSISNQFGNGRITLSAGASILYELSPKFQLQSGLTFINKIYQNGTGASWDASDFRYQATYLQMPLSVRMKLGKRNLLSLGSFLGKPITYKATKLGNEFIPDRTVDTQLSSLTAWDTGTYSAYHFRFYQNKKGFMEMGAIGQISLSPFWRNTNSRYIRRFHAFSLQLSYFFK